MASTVYIQFEDPAIAPGSTVAGHDKEMEILSWSHGFVQPTSPTRGANTVEQANHQNLTFTKYLDAATNDLLKFCWSGRQIGKATIRCYRGDAGSRPVLYLTVAMQQVIISNYSVSGGPGDVPVENVSLDYGIVQYTVADANNPDGRSATHDLETRTIS